MLRSGVFLGGLRWYKHDCTTDPTTQGIVLCTNLEISSDISTNTFILDVQCDADFSARLHYFLVAFLQRNKLLDEHHKHLQMSLQCLNLPVFCSKVRL